MKKSLILGILVAAILSFSGCESSAEKEARLAKIDDLQSRIGAVEIAIKTDKQYIESLKIEEKYGNNVENQIKNLEQRIKEKEEKLPVLKEELAKLQK